MTYLIRNERHIKIKNIQTIVSSGELSEHHMVKTTLNYVEFIRRQNSQERTNSPVNSVIVTKILSQEIPETNFFYKTKALSYPGFSRKLIVILRPPLPWFYQINVSTFYHEVYSYFYSCMSRWMCLFLCVQHPDLTEIIVTRNSVHTLPIIF